ncbi:glycyl-radical enzyme activating protein [uncultured Mailhella sp.]|uniref:glycyl-radical enzyme activating protein n=1 Tax=uncultured Mailhella sp. TaxID=1981031 RepID=UPI002623CAC1|nr:glycyl-radical enzyme activating protein [uncultured Mailhella sp.]
MQDRLVTGHIFNIQKYSVHDGPGIRTILFFKGCPLHCRWCSNPESQSAQNELAFNSTRCLTHKACGTCADICPNQAISFSQQEGFPVIERKKCHASLCRERCSSVCHAGALKIFGKYITVEEALREVEKDAVFYQRSSGGLTVSGGEPCFQPEFLLALLSEAERRYLDTAMETCGQAPYEVLRGAAAHLNTLIFDIKHTDASLHKAYTGVENSLILENIKKLCAEFRDLPILLRTPVIPGFNDSEDAIRELCAFVAALPGKNISYELLAYHRLGTQKYQQLGRDYRMGDIKLDNVLMTRLKNFALVQLGERFVA